MRIAIVGAGIMGASAARFLARRGHAVTLFDQHGESHALGSSHGRSRIVRKAYPDPFFTEIMQDGYPMWHELEAELNEPLLDECGLMYYGPGDAENIRSMAAGLAAMSVPFEVLEADDARALFPNLTLHEDEVGVWTSEAGWVRADLAVKGSIDLAKSHGAQFIHRRVESLSEIEAEFDAVVLTPGGWIGKFVDVNVDVQARTFAYLEGAQGGPVWIEEGPGLHYGFPSEPGQSTFKIGGHVCDFPFEPDRTDRPVNQENVEAIRDLARRRFGVVDPVVKESALCLYTWRDNEDFAIGRATEKTVFASACSGHGFKFGPWVGRYLADLVEGRRDPSNYPRFDTKPAPLA
jgi:sarcosine oxidase